MREERGRKRIALLRRAAEISSEGHRATLLAPMPQHEYELQAVLEYNFTRLGGTRPAYGSIVGSGQNGTQLHYMKDRGVTKPGDVVVMDAAAEYEGYAADITRTIPVSGTFTAEQRTIYQLVRDAQSAAERNSKPGKSAAAAQDSSVVVRTRGLAALGLIESEDALFDPPWQADCQRNPVSCRQAAFWMIHGISHGLGLAVHDPVQASYGERVYKPGDVFSIEPGIYISAPDARRPAGHAAEPRVHREGQTGRGSGTRTPGVRIEDDYLITETGHERLSTAPREIAEIEALMKKRARTVP